MHLYRLKDYIYTFTINNNSFFPIKKNLKL